MGMLLDEIDFELAELMRRMKANEQYDTGYNDAWRTGWAACDKQRIVHVANIREKFLRRYSAAGKESRTEDI